jgi:hypothetical protein
MFKNKRFGVSLLRKAGDDDGSTDTQSDVTAKIEQHGGALNWQPSSNSATAGKMKRPPSTACLPAF